MSSSIAMSVLRGENGKVFGNWKACEVTGTFTAPRLVIQCESCSNRQIVDVNQWYSITKDREFRCSNASNHRAQTKAVPQAQPLTREVLDKMPADEYKRRMLHEPGFEEQANAIYNSGPKQLNHREACEQKAARDKQARMEPHRKMFVNAWHAYDNQGLQPPFHRLEGWLALSEAERQGIIKRFSLDTVDHTPNLDRMLGRA
jgi:hypothetical protein